VFVPLSAATFATLSPEMRAQGTSIYSLVRNIGSSIGISLVQTMLTRNTVIAHSSLAERVTAASPAWHNPAVAAAFSRSPGATALLDGAVTQQAAMIAYIDDFWFMLFLTLLVVPLLLFIRPPRQGTAVPDAQAVMD
jgi:MFS transporter, DHA2 family, multidrug resistance protein